MRCPLRCQAADRTPHTTPVTSRDGVVTRRAGDATTPPATAASYQGDPERRAARLRRGLAAATGAACDACRMHLAQLNVARLLQPLEAPETAEFVAALAPVNALADAAPGFVWRLQEEGGDATSIRVGDDALVIVNMSVWESLDALRAFVYRSDHRMVLRRKRDWFGPWGGPHLVLFWVSRGRAADPGRGARPARAPGRGGPDRRGVRLQAPVRVRRHPDRAAPRGPGDAGRLTHHTGSARGRRASHAHRYALAVERSRLAWPTALAGIFAFSFSAALFKLSGAPPAVGSTLRFAYATPLLIVLAVRAGGLRRGPELAPALIAGVIVGVEVVAWNEATSRIGAGPSTVIVNTASLWLMAIAAVVLRRRIPLRAVGGAVVVVLGLALLRGVGSHGLDAVGVALAVAAAAMYGAYLLLFDAAVSRSANRVAPVLWATAAAVPASLVFAVVLGGVVRPRHPASTAGCSCSASASRPAAGCSWRARWNGSAPWQCRSCCSCSRCSPRLGPRLPRRAPGRDPARRHRRRAGRRRDRAATRRARGDRRPRRVTAGPAAAGPGDKGFTGRPNPVSAGARRDARSSARPASPAPAGRRARSASRHRSAPPPSHRPGRRTGGR